GDPGGGGPGGGGAGGIGGIGGGGGGGAGGGYPGEGTPTGIKVTVCSGHGDRAAALGWDTANLYMPASETRDEATIVNVRGICVSVPTGPVVEDPDPAFWLWGGREYDSCSDCT